jgi:hypothetical protein
MRPLPWDADSNGLVRVAPIVEGRIRAIPGGRVVEDAAEATARAAAAAAQSPLAAQETPLSEAADGGQTVQPKRPVMSDEAYLRHVRGEVELALVAAVANASTMDEADEDGDDAPASSRSSSPIRLLGHRSDESSAPDDSGGAVLVDAPPSDGPPSFAHSEASSTAGDRLPGVARVPSFTSSVRSESTDGLGGPQSELRRAASTLIGEASDADMAGSAAAAVVARARASGAGRRSRRGAVLMQFVSAGMHTGLGSGADDDVTGALPASSAVTTTSTGVHVSASVPAIGNMAPLARSASDVGRHASLARGSRPPGPPPRRAPGSAGSASGNRRPRMSRVHFAYQPPPVTPLSSAPSEEAVAEAVGLGAVAEAADDDDEQASPLGLLPVLTPLRRAESEAAPETPRLLSAVSAMRTSPALPTSPSGAVTPRAERVAAPPVAASPIVGASPAGAPVVALAATSPPPALGRVASIGGAALVRQPSVLREEASAAAPVAGSPWSPGTTGAVVLALAVVVGVALWVRRRA